MPFSAKMFQLFSRFLLNLKKPVGAIDPDTILINLLSGDAENERRKLCQEVPCDQMAPDDFPAGSGDR
jgi:hypothetical protein